MAVETTDATCDVPIDYVEHVISIQIGSPSETDASFTRFQQTVNFDSFNTVTTTTAAGAVWLTGFNGSFVATVAGILAIAF